MTTSKEKPVATSKKLSKQQPSEQPSAKRPYRKNTSKKERSLEVSEERKPDSPSKKKPSPSYVIVSKDKREPILVPTSSSIENIRKLRAHVIAFMNREDGGRRSLDDLVIVNTQTNSVVSEEKIRRI